jgi:hypothetical protein
MKRNWVTLQQLSRDDLISEYDREAQNVGSWSLAFIRDEIFQRDREAQGARMEDMTRKMETMTRQIKTLTLWITGLTVVNTMAVITALLLGH